jgi:hypothetical protein
VEFFVRLRFQPDHSRLLWAYYRTLRRRDLGQTSALIAALMARGYTQTAIAQALGRSFRRVAANWSKVRKKFGLKGVGALGEFLRDPSAWPEGRRSRPTPQQRPVARPQRSADPAAPTSTSPQPLSSRAPRNEGETRSGDRKRGGKAS